MTTSDSALPSLRGGTRFVCPLGHDLVETTFGIVPAWGHRYVAQFQRGQCEYGFILLDDSFIDADALLAFEVYDDEDDE